MKTKVELINSAYSQLRISGLTINPTPEDTETALWRLEDMMAEYWGRTLNFNYNFEEEPTATAASGVDRVHHRMIASNLAVTLCPDFGKDVPIKLDSIARASFSASSAVLARERVRQVAYPSRMPVGSGNRQFGNRFRKFFPSSTPPITSAGNEKMLCGDINDYQSSFASYLMDETIDSYVIEVGAGLSLVTGIADPENPTGGIAEESLDQNFPNACGVGAWTCSGAAVIANNTLSFTPDVASAYQAGFEFSAEKSYTVKIVFSSTYSAGQILLGNETASGEAGNLQLDTGAVEVGTEIFEGVTGITGSGITYHNWCDASEEVNAIILELSVIEELPQPVSSYDTDTGVFYRLKANDCPYEGSACVKVTITTSPSGRVKTRERLFEIQRE